MQQQQQQRRRQYVEAAAAAAAAAVAAESSGRVQMTQAERTRTIKYVLAESSRWLLHRRRDTKKINIPEFREKKKEKKEKKHEKRKVGSKAQKQASQKIVLNASP